MRSQDVTQDAVAPDPKYLTRNPKPETRNPKPQRHTLTINGTVSMVKAALALLQYKPPPDINSKQLKSAHLNQVSTQVIQHVL
jgi:hypothetical protein